MRIRISARIMHHQVAADSFTDRRLVPVHADSINGDGLRFVRTQRDVLAVRNDVVLIFPAPRFQNHRRKGTIDRLIRKIVDPHIRDVTDRLAGANERDGDIVS